MRVPRSSSAAAAVACALAAPSTGLAAAPADTTPLIEGRDDFSVANSCSSLAIGNNSYYPSIRAVLAQEGTRTAPPRVGEVFYIRLTSVELTDPCALPKIVPEFLLPEGVRLAVDAAHPVTWQYPDQSDDPPVTDSSTVAVPDPGPFGGVQVGHIDDHGAAEPWPLNSSRVSRLILRMPIVSNRPLDVSQDPPPNPCNGQPCAPASAGRRDVVMAYSLITDGGNRTYLAPTLGLRVASAAAAAGTPGSRPPPTPTGGMRRLRVTAPRTLSRAALRRPITVKVAGLRGDRLTARLTSGARVLATARGTAGAAGTATLRLRLGAAAAARARRARTALVLRVSGRSRDAKTIASGRVTLKLAR